MIIIWDSIVSASKSLNIKAPVINSVLNKRSVMSGGFHWEYYNGDIIDGEEWTKIPLETKNDYYISNKGRIRNSKTGRVSNGYKISDYFRVGLTMKKGKPRFFPIHNLVLLSFKKDFKLGQQAIHKDQNRSNNNLENLDFIRII